MLIETFHLGSLNTNCYMLSGKDGHAAIIDPGANGQQLAEFLEKRGLGLDAIFLTHCHYDHIGGLAELQHHTGAPVYMHPAEAAVVPVMSGGLLTVTTAPYPKTITAAGLDFTVYHTPGHSPGSVCLRTGDLLFTGDTLFFGSCGRIDFAGGSWESMAASLRFLAGLEGNPSVYPGHGESSRLETERKYNPYLREAMQE